jgi:hypothetical protein
MEALKAVVDNAPGIIAAASQSAFGIVALVCLILAAATIFYLSRSPKTSPWLGFAAFALLVFGTLGLSVVSLYVGAGRAFDLAQAHVITFKTPYFDRATSRYRLLDATITRINDTVWRERQERPDGNAEFRHVIKAIEPDSIVFARAPNGNGQTTDTTELAVYLKDRELCFRAGPDADTWECPYALAAIE